MGLAIGTGELIMWPHLITKHGFSLLWLALLGIIFQFFINQEVARHSLATGEGFFQSSESRPLIAALKDCIAHPPLQNDKIDPERALNDLTRRLQMGKLQLQLREIVSELKSLSSSAESHNDDMTNDNTEAKVSPTERREALLRSYQEAQAQLNLLSQPLKSS